MKQPALERRRASAHLSQSLVSFPAKRLSLVAQTEMNGLNKEITPPVKMRDAASQAFVNDVS
jgi:hypothetical protein